MTAERSSRRRPRGRLRLLWRALAWRSGSSLAYFLVAVACVTAASSGPIELRAADQSLVAAALRRAPVPLTGVTLTPSDTFAPPSRLLALAHSIPGHSGGKSTDAFGPAILTIDDPLQVDAPTSDRIDGVDLLYRTGACAHLQFVSGTCPTGAFQVALSTRTAALLHLGLGGSFRAKSPVKRPPAMLVTGIYRPRDPSAATWWGNNFFPFGNPDGQAIYLDDGIVSEDTAVQLRGPAVAADWVQMPLHLGVIEAPSVPGFLSQLSRWTAQLASHDHVAAGSRLAAILAGADTEEQIAATIAEMVSLELLLLALLVLYSVAKATSAARATDVRVAELRGLPRRSIVVMALREPASLLVAALPVGLVAGGLSSIVIDRHFFGAGSYRGVDSLGIAAAAVAVVAGLAATTLASRTLLSGHDALGRTQQGVRGQTRAGAIADVAGLALAAAGVAGLVGAHATPGVSTSPLTYLGPGLIALGVGILASRLVPLLARLVARRLEWSRSVAGMLAARSVGRSPGIARQVMIPSIATGLAVFSVTGLAVANHNRSVQADFLVGAPVVLHVDVRPGTDFLRAVEGADPTGREAMAVADIASSFAQTLAVDTSRLAAVATLAPGTSSDSTGQLARLLSPRTPPAPQIDPGSQLRLSVDVGTGLRDGPTVTAQLFDRAAGSEDTVAFGRLRPGAHVYNASLSSECLAGCRLDSMTLSWSPHGRSVYGNLARARDEASYVLSLTSLTSVRATTATRDPVNLAAPRYWRLGKGLSISPAGGGEYVADLLDRSFTLTPIDLPEVLPSVSTSDLAQIDATPGQPLQVSTAGLDGSDIASRSVATVSVLPRAGDDASMVSLALAEREQDGPVIDTDFEVWCNRSPSKHLLAALSQRGIHVRSVEMASDRRAALGHSGPAFGFDLFGLGALAAGILAIGWLVFSIASGARSRRVELAGLIALSTPRRVCRRALLLESTAVCSSAAVTGSLAGWIGARMALPLLPEFAPGRVGPPLDLGVPLVVVLVVGAGLLVALEIAAIVASAVLMRGVRPRLVSTAQ